FVFILGGLNFLWFTLAEWSDGPTGSQWLPDPVALLYYFVFFAFGWGLYTSRTNLNAATERAWTLVLIGFVSTLIYIAARGEISGVGGFVWELETPDSSAANDGDWIAMQAAASLGLFAYTRGLMGLFLRYASNASYAWRYISDASYYVYIVHLPLCDMVAAMWTGWEASLPVRFYANTVLVTLLCFVFYDLFARSGRIGAFLNGRRYPRGPRSVRAAGVLLCILGIGASIASAHDHDQRIKAWAQKGGAASLLPFGLGLAPAGETEDASTTACMPADRYAVCLTPSSFDEAVSACQSLSATLAIIETGAEFERLHTQTRLYTRSEYWIGLSDREREGQWRWGDGAPLAFSAWAGDQPDNYRDQEDCGHVFGGRMEMWNDGECDWELPFVCEFETQPRATQCQEALDALASSKAQEATAGTNLVEQVESACVVPALEPIDINAVHNSNASSPRGLEGLWSTDHAEVERILELEDVPNKSRRVALAALQAMDITVSFEPEALVLSFTRFGKHQVERVPYQVIERTETELALQLEPSDSEPHILQREGDDLVLVHGSHRAYLTRRASD
ncbi:MAG: lectin-like protein, partial [Myxococcota bacterium]|nr:lectin-like protein [Myxococcota bacterium]